jgi:hypothetical protein
MDRSEVDVESGSEIELNTKIRGGMNENAERDNDAWEGEGIKVKRDVDLRRLRRRRRECSRGQLVNRVICEGYIQT